VYICHRGTDVAGVMGVKALRAYAESLPNVVIAKTYAYSWRKPRRLRIREDIKEKRLD